MRYAGLSVEHARVEGQIDVAHVVINGTVVGPVSATESLNFSRVPVSQVMSNTISWKCSEGAVVQGRLIHQTSARTVELKLASKNKLTKRSHKYKTDFRSYHERSDRNARTIYLY